MADELFELKGRITLETKAVDKALSKLKTTLNALNASFEEGSNNSQKMVEIKEGVRAAAEELDNDTKSTNENTQAQKKNSKEVKKSASSFKVFTQQLVRIAKYRAIRTALKAISSAISEGTQSLYQFSKLTGNGEFAGAMDSIATNVAYIKSALGTALAPILQALAPLIEIVANGFAKACEAISRFFALLNGQNGYYKAIKLAKEYQKIQRQTFGFDELNILNGTTDTSSMFQWVKDFGTLSAFELKIKELGIKIDEILPEGIDTAVIGGGIIAFLLGLKDIITFEGGIDGLKASLAISTLFFVIKGIDLLNNSDGIHDEQFWKGLKNLAVGSGFLTSLILSMAGAGALTAGLVGVTVGISLSLLIERIKWGVNANEMENNKAITDLFNSSNKSTQIAAGVNWSYLINGFAGGGFPQQGTMFVAGEAGAEFVGNINGRTGVLNSTQLSAELSVANEGVVDTLVSVGNAIVSAINKKQTSISANDIRLAVGNNAMRYGV